MFDLIKTKTQLKVTITTSQAISVFKNIRMGAVSLHIARRQHVAFGKRWRDNDFDGWGGVGDI